MNESIKFWVKRWDYNHKAPLANTGTDCQLFIHPLEAENSSEAGGIEFNWIFVLSGDDYEILYYSSVELYQIKDKEISDFDLWRIIEKTYQRSYTELASRNKAVNLNTGFPPLRSIVKDLKEIRTFLEM